MKSLIHIWKLPVAYKRMQFTYENANFLSGNFLSHLETCENIQFKCDIISSPMCSNYDFNMWKRQISGYDMTFLTSWLLVCRFREELWHNEHGEHCCQTQQAIVFEPPKQPSSERFINTVKSISVWLKVSPSQCVTNQVNLLGKHLKWRSKTE